MSASQQKRTAHVRFGSVASHPDLRDAPGMSAMPPIAARSVRRNKASRCANRRHSQCSRLSYSSPRRGAPSAAKSVLIRSPGRRTQAGWATEIERLSATHARRCAASELSVIAKRAPPKCTRRSPTKVVERPRPSKGATNLQSRISVHRPLSGAKTERGG